MATDPFPHDLHLLNQHFLDPAVSRSLVDRVEIGRDDVVLDLGAGTGSVTSAIVRRRPRLTIAVETDLRCAPALETLARTATGVQVTFARIQDLEPADLASVTQIVANPPFSTLDHIATLMHRLPRLRSAHLCVSQRWATSVTAPPESQRYSLSSLVVQTTFEVRILHLIEGAHFVPPIRRPAAWLRLDRRPTIDPLLSFVADTALRQGGIKIKNLVRSPALHRLPVTATRLRALQDDPRIQPIQQRRLSTLSGPQLAQLVRAIDAHRGS